MSTSNEVTSTGIQNCPGIAMIPEDGVGCSPTCLGTENHSVAVEAWGEISHSVTTSTHPAQKMVQSLCHSMNTLKSGLRSSVIECVASGQRKHRTLVTTLRLIFVSEHQVFRPSSSKWKVNSFQKGGQRCAHNGCRHYVAFA